MSDNCQHLTSGVRNNSLLGQRVLVIEDESMLVMLVQDMLAEMGCDVVGVASRFNDAMEKTKSLSYDVAILDINLNGCQSFPIAEALVERGRAFVFATGYDAGSLPAPFDQFPVLQKPFQQHDLERVIGVAIGAIRGKNSGYHV
jgi:two-component SAPR family response regulator